MKFDIKILTQIRKKIIGVLLEEGFSQPHDYLISLPRTGSAVFVISVQDREFVRMNRKMQEYLEVAFGQDLYVLLEPYTLRVDVAGIYESWIRELVEEIKSPATVLNTRELFEHSPLFQAFLSDTGRMLQNEEMAFVIIAPVATETDAQQFRFELHKRHGTVRIYQSMRSEWRPKVGLDYIVNIRILKMPVIKDFVVTRVAVPQRPICKITARAARVRLTIQTS